MYRLIEEKDLIEIAYDSCIHNLYSWDKVQLKNFNVHEISNGNFLCSINHQESNKLGIPENERKIVLKLDLYNPLKSTLITCSKNVEIISAYEFYKNDLGPKILSVFKNGRIEEYLKGISISNLNDSKDDLQILVAQSIAKIHSFINIPAEKNKIFLEEKIKIFLKLIYKQNSKKNFSSTLNFMSLIFNEKNKVFEIYEYNLEKNEKFDIDSFSSSSDDSDEDETKRKNSEDLKKLQKIENLKKIFFLNEELSFLFYYLNKLDTDIVFSHNDLHQENIFINNKSSDEKKVFISNYDLCGYNFRGYDIAHYLNNITFDFSNLVTDINFLKFVNDNETIDFIENYLNETKKIQPKFIENKQKLFEEVKFFSLISSFLSILVTTLSALTNDIENLDYLKLRIEVYFKFKNEYIELQKSFKNNLIIQS